MASGADGAGGAGGVGGQLEADDRAELGGRPVGQAGAQVGARGASERAAERLEPVGSRGTVDVDGPSVALEVARELVAVGRAGARLDRARVLLEEVRCLARVHGRPFDRELLRLVEAVLDGVSG